MTVSTRRSSPYKVKEMWEHEANIKEKIYKARGLRTETDETSCQPNERETSTSDCGVTTLSMFVRKLEGSS